ncbi:unnamed protein product, partial [Symbiodinium pilosum]
EPLNESAGGGPDLAQGEILQGEFVFVSYKGGKHQGFIKRHYLVAMAMPAEPDPPGKRRKI